MKLGRVVCSNFWAPLVLVLGLVTPARAQPAAVSPPAANPAPATNLVAGPSLYETGKIGIVPGHDLDDALEAAEHRRALSLQIDQHLLVNDRVCDVINDDRCNPRQSVTAPAMRKKADRGLHPQHPVRLFGGLRVGRQDQQAHFARERLGCKRAHHLQLVVDMNIEIDLRHRSRSAARIIRERPPAASGTWSTWAPAVRSSPCPCPSAMQCLRHRDGPTCNSLRTVPGNTRR